MQREEAGEELYRELLALVKDKSVVLEEYATRMVAAEAVHIREMELMLMKRAPDSPRLCSADGPLLAAAKR